MPNVAPGCLQVAMASLLEDVPLEAGDEITVSYVEIYAARAARQDALQSKKGFACACKRCEAPPAADAPLDGWACVATR